ncbi:VOC family protein [Streptomyces sp. NPDC097610]|uniref:VOC family protein n=1 Tax=Streptomyces sp. NPDC097610 TaxID=3157227 RepID=UPI00332F1A94
MIVPGDMFEICFVVRNLEAAVEQYHKAFGYTFSVILDGVLPTREAATQEDSVPPLRMAVSREQHPQIELLEAVPDTHLVPPTGTGLHHLGYYVDDLSAASEALAALGVPLVRGGVVDGVSPVSWAYHEMGDGTLIELVDRQSAPLRTMITVGQVPPSPWARQVIRLADGWRPADS